MIKSFAMRIQVGSNLGLLRCRGGALFESVSDGWGRFSSISKSMVELITGSNRLHSTETASVFLEWRN
jgi:hypothetical protein